jgi:hypothetical protein
MAVVYVQASGGKKLSPVYPTYAQFIHKKTPCFLGQGVLLFVLLRNNALSISLLTASVKSRRLFYTQASVSVIGATTRLSDTLVTPKMPILRSCALCTVRTRVSV